MILPSEIKKAVGLKTFGSLFVYILFCKAKVPPFDDTCFFRYGGQGWIRTIVLSENGFTVRRL